MSRQEAGVEGGTVKPGYGRATCGNDNQGRCDLKVSEVGWRKGSLRGRRTRFFIVSEKGGRRGRHSQTCFCSPFPTFSALLEFALLCVGLMVGRGNALHCLIVYLTSSLLPDWFVFC